MFYSVQVQRIEFMFAHILIPWFRSYTQAPNTPSSGPVDREKIYQWIVELSSPDTRENALLELRFVRVITEPPRNILNVRYNCNEIMNVLCSQ